MIPVEAEIPNSSQSDKNHLVHFGDNAGQNLVGVKSSTDILKIEREMISLLPARLLFGISGDDVQRAAHSHLAEMDFSLTTDGSMAQSNIKQVLIQMSAEAIPKTTVDKNGELIHPNIEAVNPWDRSEKLEENSKKSGDNLDNWNIFERFHPATALQEVSNAARNSAAVEVLSLNRDNGTLVVCHDPVGTGSNQNQNLNTWSETTISDLGFREWVEHIQEWFYTKNFVNNS